MYKSFSLIFLIFLFLYFLFTFNAFSQPYKEKTPSVISTPSAKTQLNSDEDITHKINNTKDKGFPVTFYGTELFRIHTNIGPLSAKDRAETFTKRLEELYKEEKKLDPDKIEVTLEIELKGDFKGEKLSVRGINIVYEDHQLYLVDEEEAILRDMTLKELAESYKREIRDAIIIYKDKTSFKNLIKGILYSLIATIALILFFVISSRIFNFLNKKLTSLIKEFKFQKITLINNRRLLTTLTFIQGTINFIVKIIFLYIYLTFVFSLFIWTEGYGDKLFEYIMKALIFTGAGIKGYIPNLFIILIIVIIAYYIIKFVRFVHDAIATGDISIPGFNKDWAMPTYRIFKFLLITLTVIIVFPYLPGGNTPAFKGISVFMGILLSLGSSSLVGNVIAGIVIIYTNSFRAGDFIEVEGIKGYVIEQSLLVTHLKTNKNVFITYPNSKLLSGNIINYSTLAKEKGLIINAEVTLGYDVPVEKARKALIEAALSAENFLSDPPPFVLLKGLEDNYITYELNVYTDKPTIPVHYSKLYESMYRKCNEAGIEILSPAYQAIRDGNQSTMAPDFIPAGYKSPPFKICSVKEEEPGAEEQFIRVIIENCSFNERNKLMEYLKSLDGIENIEPLIFKDSTAIIKVQYNKTEEELAEEITKIKDLKIEIIELHKKILKINYCPSDE